MKMQSLMGLYLLLRNVFLFLYQRIFFKRTYFVYQSYTFSSRVMPLVCWKVTCQPFFFTSVYIFIGC
ncbi:hypothetical protein FB192DRAFT_1384590 [Mucor lusitanicus]|uniref:Uncharacterized protein n=1 Tax=Mucor circinelloides f. lusitanicus TaxID=29924 RepID=A0A8H4F073_MUCCL|nr:hypothetical protein FB192DRAFT_1384590 [Mucor lusitanicus]